MLGVYFSGTGNTKHCVKNFVKEFHNSNVISIEEPNVVNEILKSKFIVLGYPIYYSNAPKIMQDFIIENKNIFKNKKVFIIATMGLFSGDGTGCTARLLKKYGGKIIGGLHIKMPDCIGDEKVLKKSAEQNKKIVLAAEHKIKKAALNLKKKKPAQDGLNIAAHLVGLLGQRLWFYKKSNTYQNKPKINSNNCTCCGLCVRLCPMKNLQIKNKKAISQNRCTLCYRCFSHCPQKAITILGKKVYVQYLMKEDK